MNQVIKADESATKSFRKSAEHSNILNLPMGLVGFSELKEMEILYTKEELPFMRIRKVGEGKKVEFLVIEPYGLIPDYKIEISDQDLKFLEITNQEQVLVLNIATVTKNSVSVNLIGPIIANRITRKAKQVVIENNSEYSEKFMIYEGNH